VSRDYLNTLRDEIHKNAVEKGWWDEERSFGDVISLCHSELSEALEEYRRDNKLLYYVDDEGDPSDVPTNTHTKPEGIAIEFADVIIRILDYCGYRGINIDEAIRIKNEFNKTRPYRHGGKRM